MKVIFLKRPFLLLILLAFVSACSQKGIASWYGKDFHGRLTASGETYNMYAMTAAHKTLPLGTVLLVTSLENGKKVKVTVNDRGPFVKGRIIDLSYAAFKKLERPEKGTTRVRLETLGRDGKYVRYIKFDEGGKGEYVIQLGSFSDKRNARRMKEVLGWKYGSVYVEKASVRGKQFYRVRIGKFKSRKKARKLATSLAGEGYEVVIMRE